MDDKRSSIDLRRMVEEALKKDAPSNMDTAAYIWASNNGGSIWPGRPWCRTKEEAMDEMERLDEVFFGRKIEKARLERIIKRAQGDIEYAREKLSDLEGASRKIEIGEEPATQKAIWGQHVDQEEAFSAWWENKIEAAQEKLNAALREFEERKATDETEAWVDEANQDNGSTVKWGFNGPKILSFSGPLVNIISKFYFEGSGLWVGDIIVHVLGKVDMILEFKIRASSREALREHAEYVVDYVADKLWNSLKGVHIITTPKPEPEEEPKVIARGCSIRRRFFG